LAPSHVTSDPPLRGSFVVAARKFQRLRVPLTPAPSPRGERKASDSERVRVSAPQYDGRVGADLDREKVLA